MVESWGRGISKILEECANAGVPEPFFELTMGGVDVRFSPKIITEKEKMSGEMSGKSTVKSTVKSTMKSTMKALKLIEENPYITIPELAELLDKSKSAIEKQIAKLKANQKIERVGADKGGHWQIINTTK